MAALGDRWLLVAPDLPSSGYSQTTEPGRYGFAGYADVLHRFTEKMQLERFALWWDCPHSG
jgi:pimeloyl-ACP methyl ester carboxylesterase